MWRSIAVCVLLIVASAACSGGADTRPDEAPQPAARPGDAALEAVTIPALPDWVDKYADPNAGDVRYFNISALMERYELTRHQAVEVQNRYRDLTRADPGRDRAAAFDEALALARAGDYESGLAVERLAAAPFIVVFDLDETFYDQYYDAEVGEGCHDAAVELADGGVRYLKFVPGWAEAIERIRALGGEVVIFSANLDETNTENLSRWPYKDATLLDHPDIAGVMTNSYLILQEKSEGTGASNPRRGNPVREPSKDLRIVDPTLTRAIIIDDNPTRLFQFRNTRVFKKFEADLYCTAEDPRLRAAFERAMPEAIDEIEEAAAYMRAEGVDFVTAYLPYTSLGLVTRAFLIDAGGMSEHDAIDYIRAHPEVVDHKY